MKSYANDQDDVDEALALALPEQLAELEKPNANVNITAVRPASETPGPVPAMNIACRCFVLRMYFSFFCSKSCLRCSEIRLLRWTFFFQILTDNFSLRDSYCLLFSEIRRNENNLLARQCFGVACENCDPAWQIRRDRAASWPSGCSARSGKAGPAGPAMLDRIHRSIGQTRSHSKRTDPNLFPLQNVHWFRDHPTTKTAFMTTRLTTLADGSSAWWRMLHESLATSFVEPFSEWKTQRAVSNKRDKAAIL